MCQYACEGQGIMKKYSVSNKKAFFTTACAVKLTAECTVASTIYGTLVINDVSANRTAMLVILYNVLSSFLALVAGILAENTKNKGIGIKLGTMLLASGFLIPVSFSINLKIILLGIGMAFINGFAGCDILEKTGSENLFGIGTFSACGLIGLAIGRYASVVGYFTVCVAMVCAALYDSPDLKLPESYADHKEKKQVISNIVFAVLFFLCIIFLSVFSGNIKTNLVNTRKGLAIVFVAMALGRAAGDFISRLCGKDMAAALSVTVGFLLYRFSPDSDKMALLCIAAFNACFSPLVRVILEKNQKHPGICIGIACSAGYAGKMIFNYVGFSGQTLTGWTAVVCVVTVFVCVSDQIAKLFLKHRNETF